MLGEVVIDTNVLSHAQNPLAGRRFSEAQQFLTALRSCSTLLCVDPGFRTDDRNRSLIGAEYRDVLGGSSAAYQIVAFLFANKRYREVARTLPQDVARAVRAMVTGKRDRTFVAVAYNSIDKTLTSHDTKGGFQPRNRARLAKALGVRVVTAGECYGFL